VLLLTSGVQHNNLALARLGSYATYPQLLRAGVRIFEYQPTMLHAKAILIDRAWCAVGSPNLDACSLRFNLEVALGTCDPRLVAELASWFEADLAAAVEVTPPAWRRLPLMPRLGGVLARPLRYLL
jgi:cardiolipin synthase